MVSFNVGGGEKSRGWSGPARAAKAQMQMGETIFAVFFIIIIIAIGLIAYSKVQEGKIKDLQRQAQEDRIIELAHSISGWPELVCSVREAQDPNCIDIVKLQVLADFMNANHDSADSYASKYYSNLLGRSEVSVSQVYPENMTWILYDNSQGLRAREAIDVPVSLYNPASKAYSLGVVTIYAYRD
jgi:hypothetical protein